MNYNHSITKLMKFKCNNLYFPQQKWTTFHHLGRNKMKQNYMSYIRCLNEKTRYLEKNCYSFSHTHLSYIQKNKKTDLPPSLSYLKIHTHNGLYSKEKPNEGEDIKKKSEEELEQKLTLYQKFKLMYKRYWYVLIPVHAATSIVWYTAFFFAAKSGVDIVPLLEKLGTTEKFLYYIRDTNAGYYGIAYAMYKIATPARYTVTLGGTTISINYLKNRGYIKPVPTKEELKHMYEDKKDELIEKREEFREKYQEKREEIKERYQEKKDEFRERTDEMREKYTERRKELVEKYNLAKKKKDEEEKR